MSRCKWCAAGKPFGHYANPDMHLVEDSSVMRFFEQCRENWSDEDIERADRKTAEIERKGMQDQ